MPTARKYLKPNQKLKTIYLDLEWNEYKKKNTTKLLEAENIELFKERSKVEHGYAKLKHNYKLSRLRHHGLKMNNLVLGIYSMAINIHVFTNSKGMNEENENAGEGAKLHIDVKNGLKTLIGFRPFHYLMSNSTLSY